MKVLGRERKSLPEVEIPLLRELEQQLKKNIPKITKSDNCLSDIPDSTAETNKLNEIICPILSLWSQTLWNNFGFAEESNEVTELTLYNRGLKSLPESFGNLINLQILDLGDNIKSY